MSGNNLRVYIFQGNKGEKVSSTVAKLIVNDSVQVLPTFLCCNNKYLLEVSLSYGLVSIDRSAFHYCENLREINIPNTVQYIGVEAFMSCKRLTKIDFEFSTSSPQHHQLRTIGEYAFSGCRSLLRIKVPSSVTTLGEYGFDACSALIEMDLSRTNLTEISPQAFACCSSLQTVSLPNTLERISSYAFHWCFELVTVVVPHGSQPIMIGTHTFNGCGQLANLLLPRDSTAEERSFVTCVLLHERYGEESSRIVAGLVGRFDKFSIHRMCCDHSSITVQQLQQCIADQEEGESLVDEFGMTPFHVLFSTIEPRIDLLDVLLESLPNQILRLKEVNGKRPLDYLMNNWSDGNILLFQRTLQKWMIDRIDRWGATSWREGMQSKVQEILAEDEKERRAALYNEVHSGLEHYENVESISILDMTLWKGKLKSGWSNDGSKRQALDRGECRCVCGSDVVIPNVMSFL